MVFKKRKTLVSLEFAVNELQCKMDLRESQQGFLKMRNISNVVVIYRRAHNGQIMHNCVSPIFCKSVVPLTKTNSLKEQWRWGVLKGRKMGFKQLKNEYRNYRNKLTTLIEKTKYEHYQNEIKKMTLAHSVI